MAAPTNKGGGVTATVVATPRKLSTADLEPIDAISPELCLVDPDLARRARALLPVYDYETRDGHEPRHEPFAAPDFSPEENLVISPELALVDPELAAWARARLPDPRTFGPVVPLRDETELQSSSATARLRVEEGARPMPSPQALEFHDQGTRPALRQVATAPEASEDSAATHRRRRRRIMRRVASAAGIAASTAILIIAGLLAAYTTNERSQTAPAAIYSATPTTFTASRASAPGREAHRVTGRDATSKTARSHSSPSAQNRAHAKTRAKRVAPSPPPVFAWVPVHGATSYFVRFFRGRKTVLQAFPTKPRLTLPERWRYRGIQFHLTPGRYRWEVRPVFGQRSRSRYGKVIVESTWTYVTRPQTRGSG